MKRNTIIYILLLAACLAGAVFYFASDMKEKKPSDGYVGKSEIKVEGGRMTPETLLSFGRLSDPQMSPDGDYILYGVSYTSIEGNRSCRNLHICSVDGRQEQEITSFGESVSNARWIDGGKRIAYIHSGQICTMKIRRNGSGEWETGRERVISDIPSGVYGFEVSPDGSSLMYSTGIKSRVQAPSDIYSDLPKADAICTDDLMYRHWDHWVKEIPHTFTAKFPKKGKITPENSLDILGAGEEAFELPIEPFGGLEQLSWSPDGRFIAYSCKKESGKKYAFSTDTEIYIHSIETGGTVRIPMDGGYDTDPVWSPDGSSICWISMARNGYEADRQRLMIAEINAEKMSSGEWLGKITEITSGFRYNAASPVWNGPGEIYFNALTEGLQAIYKASLGENGWTVERVTGEDLWYDFDTPFAFSETPEGKTVLHTSWCSMNFPTELVNVTGGKPEQVTCENAHILSQLREQHTEARMVRTVDQKEMLTWVIYPSDFDRTKKYPAIEILLGGPQGTLSQGWSYRWNYRLMADQGYVVILPNRRGTTAFGQEWTEQISGDYCGLNMQDYLSAAKDLKAEPYIGKMAACGASYGGYSAYYLCGVHGNTYDAFIAHAGIFNEEHMYLTTEEMWFPNWDNGGIPDECLFDEKVGTEDCPVGPAGDGVTFGGIRQSGSPWSSKPEAVRHYANSPHKLVRNWHTPILVIHGGMDFRVPVDEGMAAYNAAQLMGVPSKLLIFPDENHWILKPQNALFWHRQYFDWLDRWCK